MLAFLPLLLATPGCPGVDTDDCACSMEFRIIQVRVVDEAGQPVPGVDVVVTLARTGEVLTDGFDVELPEGSYVVVTDGVKDRIRHGLGDEVWVRGSKDGTQFETEYLITVDDCRCHVSKSAGPDRVVIR